MSSPTQVLELFPVPVFSTQAEAEVDNAALCQLVYAIHREEQAAGTATKAGYSAIGGFHSYDLLRRPGFEPLKRFIVNTLNERILGGKWYREGAIDESWLTTMWAMVNKRGHANASHTHPNSWFSGVYYAKLPANPKLGGDLCFHDPIATRTFTQSFYRSAQTETFSLTPKEGLLVLFPSWFEHSVKANQTDEDRISIAFNIRR